MPTIKLMMIAALCQLPLAAMSQTPDAAARGREAYMAAGCYQCHGTIGHGGVGPKLAPNPMPLAAMTAFVRFTNRNMPAYVPQVLSDADIQRIHAYLSSIKASGSPDQVPLLK